MTDLVHEYCVGHFSPPEIHKTKRFEYWSRFRHQTKEKKFLAQLGQLKNLGSIIGQKKTKNRGLSPQTNCTDWAIAACRRSWYQLLRIEGCRVVSAADPLGCNLGFLNSSSLGSCTAVLINLLLSGFRNRCQSLRRLLFASTFCFINMGQSLALCVPVWSGVAFQPAHWIVSLKNLTAASLSSSVLRETFKVNLSLMSCLKSFQFVCLLRMPGFFFWFSACAVSVVKTGG
jgi:hypothetical protein